MAIFVTNYLKNLIMKVLKNIAIVLGVLVVLFVIVGFLLPSKFKVERSLVIKAPQDQLFDQINNLAAWNNWSAWNKMDPNMKVTYSDATAGVGAVFSWTSQNKDVGAGKITLTKSEPGTLVEGKMEFEGMPASTLINKLEAQDEGVKVTMGMEGEVSNILYRYMFTLFGEKMVGDQYDKSLKNLQEYVANNPPAPKVETPAEPMIMEGDSNTVSPEATPATEGTVATEKANG